MVLGHESSGTVVSVGSKVSKLKPGDPVAMEPGVPCRRCIRCKEGTYNLCPNMGFAATPPYDGTLARYYVLPEDYCYLLPDTMSLEEGALIEPLAVAVHIVRQCPLSYGDSVVVFGAGPVGLLCCAVAKSLGAGKVISVDIIKSRLEFAAHFASTSTHALQVQNSAEENAHTLINEHNLSPTGAGVGADIAIDASGANLAIQTGIHVLRPGGTYVQGGMGKSDLPFPIMACCTKQLNVRGSFRYNTGDYEMAIALVADGKVDVKSLISRKVPFTQAEAAFVDTADRSFAGIKTLICGSGEEEG
jgi:D-xylulose reductase